MVTVTAVSEVFACCPPGPPLRVAIHASFTTRVPPCSGPSPCDAVSELVGGSTLTLELGGYQPPVGRVVPDTYLHAELFTTGTPVGFGGGFID